MKRAVIIVAGGRGTRMGGELPKQFRLIQKKPVLAHTLLRFHEFDPELQIVVVLPENWMNYWVEACKYLKLPAHKIAKGGKERFHSVKSGLEVLEESDIIGVHDAVRPLVSTETLRRCFDLAAVKGSAVPAVPLADSLRKMVPHGSEAVDRSAFVAVQTPQCFQTALLRQAYQQVHRDDFTDDASVAESAGIEIHLTAGNAENIKLTTPVDLHLAELLLRHGEK